MSALLCSTAHFNRAHSPVTFASAADRKSPTRIAPEVSYTCPQMNQPFLVPQAGDVGFLRQNGFPAPEWWIRFAEARKYGKDRGPLSPAHWNHTFLIVGDGPGAPLIEATPGGIQKNSLDEYAGQEVMVVRPSYPDPASCSRAVAAMTAMVGQPYGFSLILPDALSMLFNTTLRIGFTKHRTCSGSVAHVLNLGGVDMGDFEEWNSPADNWDVLYRHGVCYGTPSNSNLKAA